VAVVVVDGDSVSSAIAVNIGKLPDLLRTRFKRLDSGNGHAI